MFKFTKMQLNINSGLFFIGLLVLLPIALPAAVLEEVVVTAQKREQLLSDVGIAVTAFTGDQIDALGFESSTDIISMSPGVYFSADTGGQNRKFGIRGVTQNDFLDASEAPIAVYIDEGYVSTQQGQVFGLFDLERVEVLKGPQGTLFGRNATGGLVHYVSRKPTFDEGEGYVDVTYGSYDQLRVETAVGGPLTDKIAGRVALMYNYHDGTLENNYPNDLLIQGPGQNLGSRDDLNNDNSWGFRAHTLFAPNEDVEILLSGYASRTEVAPGGYESGAIVAVFDSNDPFTRRHINTLEASSTETREAIGPGGVAAPIIGLDEPIPFEDATRPVPGGDLFGYVDDSGDFEISKDWAFKDTNKYETHGVTGKITWDLSDSMTLTSVTDYKSYNKIVSLDVDGGPTSHFLFMADAKTDTFAQELRLHGEGGRSRWVVGGYFLDIDNDTVMALPFNGDSFLSFAPFPFGLDPDPTDAVPGPGVDFATEVTLETKSYSIFGQIDYDLNDTLTLVTGLRIVFEDKDYSFAQNAYPNTNVRALDVDGAGLGLAPNFGVASTANTPFSAETSDTLWTGKIQLDWKPNDDWLVYFGINRGVKAGSFNGPLADGSQIPLTSLPYDEEVLLAYEGGFKATLFEGKARLNGSAYYYDYSDYQAFTFTNVSGIITNEDATVKGLELELTATPTDALDMIFGFSFVDANVEDVEVAPGIFRDVEPTFTPKYQLSGLVRYTWPLFSGSELAIQLDANYNSKRWANLRNFDAHSVGSNIVGNARGFWYSPDRKWEASVFVANISDERTLTERFDLSTLCGCENHHYAKPRWAGGSIRYNF